MCSFLASDMEFFLVLFFCRGFQRKLSNETIFIDLEFRLVSTFIHTSSSYNQHPIIFISKINKLTRMRVMMNHLIHMFAIFRSKNKSNNTLRPIVSKIKRTKTMEHCHRIVCTVYVWCQRALLQ